MSKEAYWFKHDSNAKDDPKCIILIEELGLEGYGIFWVLVETLRSQPDFKAPLRILPAIARRHNTSTEKVKAVISRYELFEIEDDEFFYSQSLIDRMQPLLKKKEKLRLAGKKGAEARWGNKNSHPNGQANSHPNGNKSREDKKREENNGRQATVPSLDEVKEYFTEKGYDVGLAKKFYSYYQEPMEDRNGRVWKDQNGKTVKSWKQKAISVWMKEDNKKQESNIIDGGLW